MQMDRICAGISQRRKQMGLSQEDLAKQLGVTRQAVSKWESGAALPSVDNIVELARVLEISVDELLQLEKKSSEPGLSAESVGRLLDEHALRQEKRIRRLTFALIAAAGVLVAGIVLTYVLGAFRTNEMEDNLKKRISDTNVSLQSQISGIQSSIAGTVKQALDEGSTLLTDSGCRGYSYVHESQSVEMKVFAYPKTLGGQTEAEFYALLNDGTRVSSPAEQTTGGFEGMLSIPAGDAQYVYMDVYVSWQEDGQTVTEKIFCPDVWIDDLRLVVEDVGMHYIFYRDEGNAVVLMPYAGVRMSDVYPETCPAKVLFEIYVDSELKASVGMPCNLDNGFCTLTPEEDIVLEGDFPLEDISMCVTVTDRRGNEFIEEWQFEGE